MTRKPTHVTASSPREIDPRDWRAIPQLMSGAFDCLFHGGSCLVGRQSALPRSQALSPSLAKAIPVSVRGLREPCHRFLWRPNCNSKAVIVEHNRLFPSIYEHVCTSVKNSPGRQTAERPRGFRNWGRIDPEASSATAYSWVVWIKGEADTRQRWIAPCRKRLERPDDYAAYREVAA